MRHDTLITVVGTVSPSSSDTEHTLATLRTIAAVAGTESAIRELKKDVKPIREPPRVETIPPKLWAEDRLRSWFESTISSRGEPLAPVVTKLPDGVSGRAIMRMTAVQIRQLSISPLTPPRCNCCLIASLPGFPEKDLLTEFRVRLS